jgi:hypothetical protein
MKKRAGRPSKLTPEVIERICAALRAGTSFKTAAEFAGISEPTVHAWMLKGRNAKSGKFREFWQKVTRARGVAKVSYVNVIRKAASEGDWQAAKWALAHIEPESYGAAAQKVEINANVAHQITITDAQAINILEELPGEVIDLYLVEDEDEDEPPQLTAEDSA